MNIVDTSTITDIILHSRNIYNKYIRLVEVAKSQLSNAYRVIKTFLFNEDCYFDIKTSRNIFFNYVVYIKFFDPYVYPHQLKHQFFDKINLVKKFENSDNHLIQKLFEKMYHIQKSNNKIILPLISETNPLRAECILRNYRRTIFSKNYKFKLCKKCSMYHFCHYDIIGEVIDLSH